MGLAGYRTLAQTERRLRACHSGAEAFDALGVRNGEAVEERGRIVAAVGGGERRYRGAYVADEGLVGDEQRTRQVVVDDACLRFVRRFRIP